VRFADVPIPAAVAARPRDARGYPVPAITPWENGEPRFASTGVARSFLCAVERLCSVCATPIGPGPVWRVVSGPEADAIDEALAAGREYRNAAATVEAPGHRTCMLYAAVVCPYLARPTARRGEQAEIPGLTVHRGSKRGLGGAVAGFAEVEYRYQDVMLFRFARLCEFRRHELGEEQLDELTAAVAAEQTSGAVDRLPAAPDYLMSDETRADRRFAEYLSRNTT
jgi:hypothetical protein